MWGTGIPDEKERLAKLKTRVKSLRKSSQSVLSFVISHLIKVAEHEAVNRVSVQSLSVVYGPILFQSQYDQIENAAPTGLSWFSKQSTVQNAAPDAAQLELLRNDLVKHLCRF